MGLADIVQQCRLYPLGSGRFTAERRALFVDLHDLRPVKVGRQQGVGLAQGVGHQWAVDAPIPVGLPGQRLVSVGWWLAGTGRGLGRIDFCLLVGVEHFHQQAALWTLRRQLAQQPQLQGMVIGVVVLLADQHPWRNRQALDQLLRGEGASAGEFADQPEIGVISPLGGDRWWRRCDVMGLAGSQQADQE
ncbi:hypothetical protein D3C76_892930 [compost metagenome]